MEVDFIPSEEDLDDLWDELDLDEKKEALESLGFEVEEVKN
jgi:hypothetical protein